MSKGGEMAREDHLLRLFQAYSRGDCSLFERVAESIIAHEAATNHLALARNLQRNLKRRSEANEMQGRLAPLPRDRRNGEELLSLIDSNVALDEMVLSVGTSQRVERLLEEHQRKERLLRHGLRPKNKFLLWGPPGCGKTMVAHCIAHALGLPLGVVRLSSVISSYLGDTASHIHRVFSLASKDRMVLLLDEVDAVAKQRDDPNDVGELKRVVNSLLQAMDQTHYTESLILAASNHQYLLDPAVWRRFDDVIEFPLPGPEERERYLQFLLSGVGFEGSIAHLTRCAAGMSFADIRKSVEEALRSMVLADRKSMFSTDVASEIRRAKASLEKARQTQR